MIHFTSIYFWKENWQDSADLKSQLTCLLASLLHTLKAQLPPPFLPWKKVGREK